jgi:hypothetical protein
MHEQHSPQHNTDVAHIEDRVGCAHRLGRPDRAAIAALQVGDVIFVAGTRADDGTVTAPNKAKSAGRAIDDGTVKAPNKAKSAGRAIDDGSVKSKPKKHTDPGRAVDNSGTVKSGPKDQPGRAADK